MAYDFSELEARGERFESNYMEAIEMMNDQKNEHMTTDMQRKLREHSYYYGNRDYGDDLLHLQQKKVENGEFWNNGYR